MFRFANPEYLYLLLIIPFLVAGFVYARYRRRSALARFGNKATVEGLMSEASPRRVRNKFIIYLLALLFMVLAIARPQLGSKLKEVKRTRIEIVLAIDVSNSMLAQDFEPNRLERTKYAVNQILEGLTEDKVGVIVFAGDAYMQLPMTSDYVTARNFVSQISPNMVSKQGTAIGAAISLASGAFSTQSGDSRVIILITDGENHEDNALSAAKHAAEQGIKIYAVGIGTPEGAPIQIGGDFIRDRKGEMVVSKLDEKILQEIALTTGGAYIRAGKHSLGLKEIVDKINDTEKSEFATMMFEEYDEKFQYPLATALLLLLLSMVMLGRKNKQLARFNIFK